ncbi:FOG: Transposon-encoded proteins with TYA, reverse transcriptase, integrase domains in various combinations [Plasmopara halstedii]|uniref:FOG: Transposon-encoded proteins with TYA, reverse transcriptase, integrase domains in various combinations n=1 Tax=Plasmopara halstedii TaxID=4781 RepID=A0A0P1B4J4_PLAHL|nr:FOG: Transposon-encoded proteins with TYA, reverse transcriptase, integrase domains in various combinations [Plasmopara halstedii]CEG49713.1 FOG: Transposon-encoded proteins with TYA, reverse transcriptase, integrase domains in various combinations [Plasmopara halstedii]|eukprot:XP_024586082.1 FOG: Transposon-encoded proteins with TYA, reverse transcriptase, integrase domains in various combinations [Plasmopara halstedii]
MRKQERTEDLPDGFITGYSDADFAADTEDRKSMIGGVIFVERCNVGWICQKQTSVSQSTAESEFIAASVVATELHELYNMLDEVGIQGIHNWLLFVDNQAAIVQLKEESSTSKLEHVDIRYKYVQERIRNGMLEVKYVQSEEIKADLMTKALSANKLGELRALCGLVDDVKHTEGGVLETS